MDRGRTRTRSGQPSLRDKSENRKSDEYKKVDDNIPSMAAAVASNLATAIENLSKNVNDLKNELKQDLLTFKNDFSNDIKQEFNNFKLEMNHKLENALTQVNGHETRLTEAEQRVEELESANTDLRDALLHSIRQQKTLQTHVTDLEGRSRRNNVRIYGIKEGSEGTSMATFINDFLKMELTFDADIDLQIQRAHRSLGPKPTDDNISRSILVNFQTYDTKDKVLKAAWAKKITHKGKAVWFAHDLPSEINNQMKEYKDIKKLLKEKQIRFQTPYPAKLRVHWQNGPRVYNNATEAAEDMKRRGYPVNIPKKTDADWEQRLNRSPHWSRQAGHSERARERLREFQRQESQPNLT